MIPERVITRPPSAELRADQKDSDSLPPHEILDAILEAYVEQQLSIAEIVAKGFAGSHRQARGRAGAALRVQAPPGHRQGRR